MTSLSLQGGSGSGLGHGEVQLLVCLLVITQWVNQPQLLQVTPANQSPRLDGDSPTIRGRGDGHIVEVSCPGAFCGACSRTSSLQVMGNLGHNTSCQMWMILWSRCYGERHCHCWICCQELLVVIALTLMYFHGLSMLIISSVAGVEGTGQMPEGNSMSTGATLEIEAGLLTADRCCNSCLTHGREALPDGLSRTVDRLDRLWNVTGGMHREGWGRYFLGWYTNFKWQDGLGMQLGTGEWDLGLEGCLFWGFANREVKVDRP